MGDAYSYTIGIDNGVTGSVGVVSSADASGVDFFKLPVKREQNYTKKKGFITRIDVGRLLESLTIYSKGAVFIERPFINPQGFKTTVSAVRCLEAVLICVEMLGMRFTYVDSKQWQKAMLPTGCSGSELKVASLSVGIRLFPEFEGAIRRHKDADSLLMALWALKGGWC